MKKYNINDVDPGGYNYVKMVPDENSYFCKFSIPLKEDVVNGCIRMIPYGDGFFVKLFNVGIAEKAKDNDSSRN